MHWDTCREEPIQLHAPRAPLLQQHRPAHAAMKPCTQQQQQQWHAPAAAPSSQAPTLTASSSVDTRKWSAPMAMVSARLFSLRESTVTSQPKALAYLTAMWPRPPMPTTPTCAQACVEQGRKHAWCTPGAFHKHRRLCAGSRGLAPSQAEGSATTQHRQLHSGLQGTYCQQQAPCTVRPAPPAPTFMPGLSRP